MLASTGGRRTAAALAGVVLCVLFAATAVSVPPADERASTMDRSGADTRVDRAQASGQSAGAGVDRSAVPGVAQTDPVRGQVGGIVVGLVVLAVIGAAAWGARGAVGDRFAPTNVLRGGRSDGNSLEGEPLTDEERIIALLEENDGRLKQGTVVEATDWSKAKVSRLLSSMEDDDAIVRIQLGREKLIFLSGHEPNSARSTLAEDD